VKTRFQIVPFKYNLHRYTVAKMNQRGMSKTDKAEQARLALDVADEEIMDADELEIVRMLRADVVGLCTLESS
jgi:hypothetical protein